MEMSLKDKIEAREAQICIIGLGYVGLPFAVEFAYLGFPVMGLDIDEKRVAAIKRGESYISDVAGDRIASLIVAGHTSYDYAWVVKHAPLIIDTVNATRGVSEGREKILRIGVPTT